ncbi:MAG: beta-ketoacyl synthase N-terminal-like domain-containing protein, partial [Trichloromonadaceae bacterium]
MILKRKSAAAQPESDSISFPQTHIRALGLACAAGDQPYALLGAVGTSLSAATQHPVLTIADAAGEETPALFAPVPGLDPLAGREERIAALATAALGSALERWAKVSDLNKVLVLTWLPLLEKEEVREIEAQLREELPALEPATLRFAQGEEGALAALTTVCRDLAAGTWDAVIFGGADSLVTSDSCRQLLQQGRLLASTSVDGICPGEAAAYLVLQADQPGADATTSHATIAAVAQAAEPYCGQADDKKMTGLAQAMEAVARQGEIRLDEVKELILTLSTESASALEWHQTLMRLWPPGTPANEENRPQ